MIDKISIRWKMTLWNAAAFALLLAAFGLLVFGLLRQTHLEHVDARLQRFLARLTSAPPVTDARAQVIAWHQDLSRLDDVRVFVRSAGLDLRLPEENLPDFLQWAGKSALETGSLRTSDNKHYRRLQTSQAIQGQNVEVILLADLHHVDEEMAEVLKAIVITALPTLAVAAALAYWLAWKALAPVEQLRQRTAEITALNLSRRLPVVNDHDELGLLAQTLNQMIERLEGSFREVQRFTGDASHELRTPIAIIRSEAELGMEGASGATGVQDRFSSILEECNRLTWMTDQLLLLCREDAGLEGHPHAEVDLGQLLTDVTEAVRPLAESKAIELSLTTAEGTLVAGSSERLRQVFYNLLDNAFKFTGAQGTVQLVVLRGDGVVTCEVRDSGCGIAAENLPFIFDRFYRVPKTAGIHPGTGLGLSIVKSIVAAHGGTVRVQSNEGSGTVFVVSLPAISRASGS